MPIGFKTPITEVGGIQGKICKGCGVWKPLEKYYKMRNTWLPYCKPCHNINNLNVKRSLNSRNICQRCCKSPLATWSKNLCSGCAAKQALEHAKRRCKMYEYLPPMPDEQFIELYIKIRADSIPCNMCGEYKENKMVIDHDHYTGEIRQVLCDSCNASDGVHDPKDRLALEIGYQILNSEIGYMNG